MMAQTSTNQQIEIVPLWQSDSTCCPRIGYFCFEIYPKIDAVTTRFRQFVGKEGVATYYSDVKKLKVELGITYIPPLGTRNLYIELRVIQETPSGWASTRVYSDNNIYRTVKEGSTWVEFVQVHLEKPMTMHYGEEIKLFTLKNVEADERGTSWSLLLHSPAEWFRIHDVRLAQEAFLKGNAMETTKILEGWIPRLHGFLHKDPSDETALYGLALAEALKQNSGDALVYLDKAIKLEQRCLEWAKNDSVLDVLRDR